MDGRRDKASRFSDEGAYKNLLTRLDHRLAGGADMHGHRNRNGLGGIHDHGFHIPGIFSVGYVYPVKRKCHVPFTFLFDYAGKGSAL
jgi:hypothetical protein